ncbi:MAG: mechanosensitive ion channel family protein [Spirochaetales bacterium]|nr:mechanosensitive ion channel family protein [Leptospiraceae bacterium]MCP5482011.1 mechanosensitive ion channel family protein [Spirochaetales bacterium]MCP5486492.1 mechanosensitive ion channel family protein [Spirochaetales bacterium]
MDFLDKVYYGNTFFEWLLAFAIMIGVAVLGRLVYWLLGNIVKRITRRTKTKIDDIIIDMAEEPLVFAIVIAGIWYALKTLNLPPWTAEWIGRVYYVLIIINIGWLVSRLCDALIEQYLVPLVEKTEGDLDDQLLPIVRKGVRLAIWAITIIIALNNAGYDVGALLAGLGIGGLAFALAAQDSVSNLFGGFTIFADKPFTINDRIKVEGFDGTVKEIGLRSTRLQTLEGRLVTIPNSAFASNPIENISSEPSRKVVLTLGLTYDTKPERIQEAIKTLKEIVAESQTTEDDGLAGFTEFADSSLNILFIYYIRKESDILNTMTEIHLEILKRFNAAGLEFAFPTRTVHNIQA